MKRNSMLLIAAASLGCLTPPVAPADDEETADDSARCLQLSRVRSTDPIDDQSVLFYMRDGKIYLNYLPRKCPRLGREKRFMYRVSLNELCDVDTITVIQDTGFGLEPGATCRLGPFNRISAEEATELKSGPHRPLVETQQVRPPRRAHRPLVQVERVDPPKKGAAGKPGSTTDEAGAATDGAGAPTADGDSATGAGAATGEGDSATGADAATGEGDSATSADAATDGAATDGAATDGADEATKRAKRRASRRQR